jgi:hypothetical protein
MLHGIIAAICATLALCATWVVLVFAPYFIFAELIGTGAGVIAAFLGTFTNLTGNILMHATGNSWFHVSQRVLRLHEVRPLLTPVVEHAAFNTMESLVPDSQPATVFPETSPTRVLPNFYFIKNFTRSRLTVENSQEKLSSVRAS